MMHCASSWTFHQDNFDREQHALKVLQDAPEDRSAGTHRTAHPHAGGTRRQFDSAGNAMRVGNAHQPAFPPPEGPMYVHGTGLTKREYIAALALQGILANGHVDYARPAESALDYADELLAALDAEAGSWPASRNASGGTS